MLWVSGRQGRYTSGMTRIVEAIFDGGVLRPVEKLNLAEHQRVRLTVETLGLPGEDRNAAARARLIERLGKSTLSHGGNLPDREQLHERNGHL